MRWTQSRALLWAAEAAGALGAWATRGSPPERSPCRASRAHRGRPEEARTCCQCKLGSGRARSGGGRGRRRAAESGSPGKMCRRSGYEKWPRRPEPADPWTVVLRRVSSPAASGPSTYWSAEPGWLPAQAPSIGLIRGCRSPQPAPPPHPPRPSSPRSRFRTWKVACPGVLARPQVSQDLLSQVDWLFIVWVTVGRPRCPLIAELMVTA